MKKITTNGKKSKKGLIALIIILVIVAVLFFSCKRAADKIVNQPVAVQTEHVSVRNLTKSIGATGTVVSTEKKDVSALVSGLEITSVNVEVGDIVKEGDLLVQFDTADIEKNLDQLKTSLATTKEQFAISSASADRTYNDTVRTANFTVENAQTLVDNALKAYNNAVDAYEDAKEDMEEYKTRMNEFEYSANCFANMINEAKASGNLAQVTELNSAYTSAYTSYNTYKAQYEALRDSMDKYEDAISTAKTAYDSQVSSYNNTVASTNSQITSAQVNQTSVSLNQSTTTIDNQIDAYEKQFRNCSVTAPISGVVTAVNFSTGDRYTAGALVTIQDCTSYEVESYIGEYDIADICLGQSVLIKTDATGDEVMNGIVSFISPVSASSDNSAMGASMSATTDVKYKIRIEIVNPSDRLRLDMSASLSIILKQHENAMCVPYNCIGVDENGNNYVTVVKADGTTKDISVQIIMESNYYTQISSEELSEGDEVQVIQSEGASDLMELIIDGGF